MIFKQTWQGENLTKKDGKFQASVPGCIQKDYATAKNFGDVHYGENCRAYEALEDDFWEYSTVLTYEKGKDDTVWFVSRGIDYKYEIYINGTKLDEYEGMYRIVELNLTEHLNGKNDVLSVRIYPHPKSGRGDSGTRMDANESCKPPMCYGWDWNPHLLISGMWADAYIETRNAYSITNAEVLTKLDKNLTLGEIFYSFDCQKPCDLFLFDEDGREVLHETGKGSCKLTLQNPKLWWCNGQGDATLYRWEIRNAGDCRQGYVGFKRLELVRNEGAGDPPTFPKSRYDAPMTIKLNGRKIMGKGSNWVNADIFPGSIEDERYETLVRYAKDANMNIFRIWGGSGLAGDAFYNACDRMGILVWQEFMLACNDYEDIPHYMQVLELEATAVIKRMRSHASLALWCGGNELFNTWSGMDDQSKPLRLLNKLCLELDYDRPFLMTSPVIGVAHGGYRFYDIRQGGEVWGAFQKSHNTAYSEFGVPSASPIENIKRAIPEDELFPPKRTPSWLLHHGFDAWGDVSWLCLNVLDLYFGEPTSLEEIVEESNALQCIGYQGIFEEARRQWPHCSMAINWCYDEPWMTVANNSLIAYPTKPKPAYYAVQKALQPALFTAKIPHVLWQGGDTFEAEIWLHNDTQEKISGHVTVTLTLFGKSEKLGVWEAEAEPNGNKRGVTMRTVLPRIITEESVWMELTLESPEGYSNSYKLLYRQPKGKPKKIILNA